jgi:hypothetical protein
VNAKTITTAVVVVAAGVYFRWATRPVITGYRLGREIEQIRTRTRDRLAAIN